MVEFNLIPWRFYLREYKKRRKKYIFIFVAAIIFFCLIFLYIYVKIHHRSRSHQPTQPAPKVQPAASPTPLFKYVGYIRQGKRFLALILSPNGKLIDVEEGLVLQELRGRV